jgi:predicted nucleic acid-binding protein
MPSVVFDTVIFVRALINPHGLWGRLLFEHYQRYRLFLSPPVLREILDVTRRPAVTRKFRSLEGLDFARVLQILAHA